MKKIKIQITSWLNGSVLFEYEAENNSIKKTLERAVGERIVLRGADLSSADLRGADLSSADLSSADLSSAVLRGADLRGADLKNLPQSYINECSRDMLYVFGHLKSELPFLREKLVNGEIDGTQYEGECACLIGTLANGKKVNADKVCEYLPFYDKGLHNPSEQWFYQIRKGDTSKNNQFAKYALKLIDSVLKVK